MQHILWVLLGRMDIMTTVKSKLLVDSQNSFLVYHFKSLNLVQNSAMSLAVIGGCSGDDAVGTVFLGIKNVSFCCFMAAIKIFRRFIGE